MRISQKTLLERAQKIVRRIDFHACETLVFLHPDRKLDSMPSFSDRARAMQVEGAAVSCGYAVVGVYRPGATADQIAADAAETPL